MQDRNITPEESLSIIQQMINNTRERYTNDGFSFLLWGLIVIIGNVVTYFSISYKQYSIITPMWLVLMVIGVVATIVIIIRRDKKNRYRSQIDFIGQMLWLSFLISWFLIAFGITKFNVDPMPYFCILLGLATFVSGALMQFTPLYFGGVLFWIASLAAPYFTGANSSLLMAAAMFAGYIIPGILLRIKVKKERNV